MFSLSFEALGSCQIISLSFTFPSKSFDSEIDLFFMICPNINCFQKVSWLSKSCDLSYCEACSSIFSRTLFWQMRSSRGLSLPCKILMFYCCNLAFETRHQVFKSILISVPRLTSLFTFTSPPICSIMSLQMLRPRPTPFELCQRCSASLLKFRNS